ncbi:Uncharacterised protein [Sphingobacterium multivorum]|uniref:Uncharacterized protein n=1 Tax=Sphingobacterium multivorum TaxID=28454 RepID=A0A2X2LUG1_SPHMU|nr:hypothetical protein [Sphingobacterium multivorum]SPZ93150.1 Uncharacterised protein [Sphingobacterium multivorum]
MRSHISMLNPIINIGYKAYSYPKRAYDVAMSYNLNHALIQEENVLWWTGKIYDCQRKSQSHHFLHDGFRSRNQVFLVTWEYDPYLEKKFDMGTYDSFLFLYNATYNGAEYPFLTNEAKNSLITGRQNIDIPKHKKQVTYEVYIFL